MARGSWDKAALRRRPRSMRMCRTTRETAARSTPWNWLRRWRYPAQSLPVARCFRSQGTSWTVKPLANRSMVKPVSTPQPLASGMHSKKDSERRQRWPESGCSGSQPVAQRIARRAKPVTKPCPPAPSWRGNSAMAQSTCPSITVSTSGAVSAAESPKSASRNRIRRRGPASGSRIATTFAPVSIAEALPRFTEWRTTVAPAPRAASPVASPEPSSTTTKRSTLGIALQARIVAAMEAASSLAGITTATLWSGCSCDIAVF